MRIFMPIGMTLIFVCYVIYLIAKKTPKSKLKAVLFPGLFFIMVWGVCYFALLR